MSLALAAALAAYLPRDRVEQVLDPRFAMPGDGVALIADMSGFTPLTEALAQQLSADRGAEELTRALDQIFTPLIAEIHSFRGSVIKFLGDALIVWYPRPSRATAAAIVRRAVYSAWRMQRAISRGGRVRTPIGEIALSLKIGLAYGPAQRFIVGDRDHGYQDVLCGRTLDVMSEAEHFARPGEIVLDEATYALVADDLAAADRRTGFVVAGPPRRRVRAHPWPDLDLRGIAAAELVAALSPYVPQQVCAALASDRVPVAALKPVICLFVLFEGIDYDRDPNAGELLQTYVVAAQLVVARYGGFLIRVSAGDKGSMLHIVFGAPQAVENQADRAVRCALDLRDACGKLAFLSAQRIGISGGRAFAGPIGAPDQRAYTTIGDTINLAARLMQRAADNQILLDGAVRAQLSPGVVIEDLGSTNVKGKAEPIAIYAAVRATVPRRAGDQARLVGRAAELAALHGRLAGLGAGQGGVALVIGEVGTGKTLLLDTLQAEARTGWAIAAGQAYGQPPGGALFADLLRDLMGVPHGTADAEAARRLVARCADLLGPAGAEAAYPFLARLLGLPLSEAVNRQLDALAGESVRWRIGVLVEALIGALAARAPLVLALDDLQWSDPTSLYLLETLLPLTARAPLLFLLALRPEHEGPAWGLIQRLGAPPLADLAVERVTLANLDAATSAALVETYAPGLPAAVIGYLAEKSSGNPLFLVELVRTLRASGRLSDAHPSEISLDDLDLPDSVQGLLLAQIDRLAVEARHVLQVAAVIGAAFERRVLAAVLGDLAIEAELATLERGGYIFPGASAPAAPHYRFAHRLLQESAYSTLLFDRRRAFHREVGAALQRLFPTRVTEQAGLLGFHYERAELYDQAVYYQLQAADQDRLLYANDEAEARYRKALDLLERGAADIGPALPERRAQTYLKIAQVRANQLDFAGAQEFYDQAFVLLEQGEAARARAASGPARAERVLQLGVRERGPVTLDPALSVYEEAYDIVRDLFEGLVELDSDMNVVPALARRWWLEDGGRRYRFELRPGLRWSDGTPLTAHDFVFAWRRNLHPATGAPEAAQLYAIEGAEEWHAGELADADQLGIRALSDRQLEIRLKAPVGYFLYLLTATITYPQPAHAIQAHGSAWGEPAQIVSNGPFRIAEWRAGKAIRIERNPFYRGFAAGNLEAARLRFVESSLQEYTRKTIDWCRLEDRDPAEHYPRDLIVTQGLKTFMLVFACAHPPFNNPLARRAFVAALDRHALVREVTAGVQLPATGGVVPPGMPGHSPDIGVAFDPAAARALLSQANLAPSPVVLGTMPGAGALPHHLRAAWQQHMDMPIDIAADIEIDDLVDRLSQGAIQVALVAWSLEYPDPDGILRVLFHSASPLNCFGWRNEQFDRLVDRAATSANQAERLALYHAADRMLVADEVAAGPLFYYRSFGLLRPPFALAGGRKSIRGLIFKLKDVVVTS